jgi:ABC-type proline/glycine betaine transport system permease subunit
VDHKPVVGSDVRREIALAPVYNALNSLALLCEAGRLRGLNAWVERSAQRLTAEQRQTHKLIFSGLRDVLVAGVAAASFADFATSGGAGWC